jgi:hypothetical protein
MSDEAQSPAKVSDKPLELNAKLTNILMVCVLTGGSWWCNAIWTEQKSGNELLGKVVTSIAVMQNEMIYLRKDIDSNADRFTHYDAAIQDVRVDVDAIKKRLQDEAR